MTLHPCPPINTSVVLRCSSTAGLKESIKGGQTLKTLRAVALGSTCKVTKLHGEGAVKRRIMDMGITKGVEIKVQKVAPLGDPMEVTVRGYQLSIRYADAATVEVG